MHAIADLQRAPRLHQHPVQSARLDAQRAAGGNDLRARRAHRLMPFTICDLMQLDHAERIALVADRGVSGALPSLWTAM